jgi:hypothetical protein
LKIFLNFFADLLNLLNFSHCTLHTPKKKKKKEAAERKFLAKGRMYRAALESQSSAGALSVDKIEIKKKSAM